VGGPLSRSLGPRFAAVGAHQMAVAKQSTSTWSWAGDPELEGWLARRPALVLVTLGANDVYTTAPEARAGAVHALARKVGAVAPCVWIAPALWLNDTHGWLQVIHDHCDPCLFFDTDAVLGRGLGDDERWSDHIHPNGRGGARWAEAFWGWLEDHRDRTRTGWALVPYATR
jgi:lysophospholipase L1-like esterase